MFRVSTFLIYTVTERLGNLDIYLNTYLSLINSATGVYIRLGGIGFELSPINTGVWDPVILGIFAIFSTGWCRNGKQRLWYRSGTENDMLHIVSSKLHYVSLLPKWFISNVCDGWQSCVQMFNNLTPQYAWPYFFTSSQANQILYSAVQTMTGPDLFVECNCKVMYCNVLIGDSSRISSNGWYCKTP